MTKLLWDQTGEKLYETGVEQCALFKQDNTGKYPKGVAWNGVTNITESPSGAEPSPLYANDTKYVTLMSVEEYAASITAYTYPDEFAECDGSAEIAPGVYAGQQERKTFGLAYKSLIGNDTESTKHGYKLNLVYGAKAAPSEKSHATINDSPEASEFSWELSTTPVPVKDHKPTASLTIDSTKVDATKLKELEDIIYGTDDAEPRLPLPDEIIELIGTAG